MVAWRNARARFWHHAPSHAAMKAPHSSLLVSRMTPLRALGAFCLTLLGSWPAPTRAEPESPPGQEEVEPTPSHLTKRVSNRQSRAPERLATHLITVTDDFVIEAYKNGRRIEMRELLDEIHGATVERMDVEVRHGDWLVFHVANNRLRWGGVKYFAVAGCHGKNEFGFVSDPASNAWSVCDDPERAREFIRMRDAGTEIRAGAIAKPWKEGDAHMRRHAGEDFPGKPLWGGGSSTWIKFVAPARSGRQAVAGSRSAPQKAKQEAAKPSPQPVATPVVTVVPKTVASPTRWPVQVLSAIYGTGGKNADVTTRVKDLVENQRAFFAVDPPNLGADPNPYWNKGLTIVYMKDGVRREQHRNENEHVLPESFYGPQDAAELAAWLPGSRWRGEKGEWQFHADRTVTGPGIEGALLWETQANNQFRITWAADRKVDYTFDYTWSSFREKEDARAVYHGVK